MTAAREALVALELLERCSTGCWRGSGRPGGRRLRLLAFGIPMTVVAAMITGAEGVLYPGYADAPRLFGLSPLEDQRLGGLIMWVPAGLIPLAAFSVVFFRGAAAGADAGPPPLGPPLP